MIAPKAGVSSTILRALPIFEPLDDESLKSLIQVAALRNIPRHKVVLHAGDRTDNIYFVVSGALKVQISDETGREVILSMLGPGELFGEMGVLDDHPRSATVLAVESSEVVVIGKADFKQCLAKNPDVALFIMRNLTKRLRLADRNIESLALLDVYGRVARLLLEAAETVDGQQVVTHKLSKQDMAKMIGASREMVSRVMRDLAAQGLVQERDGQLVLIDLATFKRHGDALSRGARRAQPLSRRIGNSALLLFAPANRPMAVFPYESQRHPVLMPLTLADFDYALPSQLIAQVPLPQRSASRLLVVDGERCTDSRFAALAQWLRAGDLLVLNDSRVLHARLLGRKDSGGQVEILVERRLQPDVVLAQLRASKPPQPGSRLRLEDALDVEVLGRAGEFYRLRFPGDAAELIERHGRLPLPPYIERTADAPDELRYQTVYAREKGSVAAPTAGLHFDQDVLAGCKAMGVGIAYVTLHVGAGTFQPVRVSDLAAHRMHTERYRVPPATAEAIAAARARGGRIVAVGTTSLRTLESAALEGGLKVGTGETALFITPGFEFRVADLLITNFHLPKSTLLMLVSAFAGFEEIRAAYRHAIDARYRFFSYGDAMLLHRKPPR